MSVRIALAGNPNCGKTTLFNALTGERQYVGNWAGVTVEKKEGRLKGREDVIITDLPGIYSLSPYTPEEVAARNYLVDERPDVILNIIDGSNIERNLYLTIQLADLGIPLVCAVNMMDEAEKRGDRLYPEKLAEALGCEVCIISALKGIGITEAAEAAMHAALSCGRKPRVHRFDERIEQVISALEKLLPQSIIPALKRWYGLKLFERDDMVIRKLGINLDSINDVVKPAERALDDDSESVIANERYTYIESVAGICMKKHSREVPAFSQMLDRAVTDRFFALPVFAAVMLVMYYVSVTVVGRTMGELVGNTICGDGLKQAALSFLKKLGAPDILCGLVTDGIIGGTGTVLGFIPQIAVLFMFLAFLEDCGYMARVAFIMDRIFRRFGLSGRSVIPMLIGTGCSVPAVMASRTIENEGQRRMTIMTAPFIPCSAKLPVIAMISGTFFGGSWWVAASAYFAGICATVISGAILKKSELVQCAETPFIMELPRWHMPSVGSVLRSSGERVLSFTKKAGTVILLSSVLLWYLQGFGFTKSGIAPCSIEDSFLAACGRSVGRVFAPLGWGDGISAAAAFSGLIAKENIAAAFGVMHCDIGDIMTPLSAYSFLMFNLLCAPCCAAMAAIGREMGTWKLTLFSLGYQSVFAYAVSLMIFQIGSLFTHNAVNPAGAGIAFVLLAWLVYMLFKPCGSSGTSCSAEETILPKSCNFCPYPSSCRSKCR